MIKSTRDNEEILQKLERIRDVCLNTKDSIDQMLRKYFGPGDSVMNTDEMLEDINFLSHNLNAAMKLCDISFKHYLIVPQAATDEKIPYVLTTGKSDSLLKYESKLMENINIKGRVPSEKNSIVERFEENTEMINYNSPRTNIALIHVNESYDNNLEEKTRESMTRLSKVLTEKLKSHQKSFKKIATQEPLQSGLNVNQIMQNFEDIKKNLNKRF